MGHFYFVRHGQTIWNVENKICGATDIALTEQGHEQAIETGKKILAEGSCILLFRERQIRRNIFLRSQESLHG